MCAYAVYCNTNVRAHHIARRFKRPHVGEVPAYFDVPRTIGRNPHRFAQCFFKRVVRVLRLSSRELLRLDASFELRGRAAMAGYANATCSGPCCGHCDRASRCCGSCCDSVKHRCASWVELFGRNSSIDCNRNDNRNDYNKGMPGLKGYEEAHPEYLFLGKGNSFM